MPTKKLAHRSDDCRICRNLHGDETFRYMGKRYIFDIDKALEFATDGRQPVVLDDDDVRFSLQDCHIDSQHTRHVDPSVPGIIAIVFARTRAGQQVSGHRLIDGHHRAARCLELGIPYRAYLLSEQESVQILIKSPCKPELAPEPA